MRTVATNFLSMRRIRDWGLREEYWTTWELTGRVMADQVGHWHYPQVSYGTQETNSNLSSAPSLSWNRPWKALSFVLPGYTLSRLSVPWPELVLLSSRNSPSLYLAWRLITYGGTSLLSARRAIMNSSWASACNGWVACFVDREGVDTQ